MQGGVGRVVEGQADSREVVLVGRGVGLMAPSLTGREGEAGSQFGSWDADSCPPVIPISRVIPDRV